MQIATRHLDKVTIFDVSGDIDMANSPQLRKVLLHELKDLRTPRVLLNLAAVRYVDSSGIASLIEGLKAAKDTGSRFSLCNLNQTVREVMQLSRLVNIFEIYDTEELALAQ